MQISDKNAHKNVTSRKCIIVLQMYDYVNPHVMDGDSSPCRKLKAVLFFVRVVHPCGGGHLGIT